MSAMFLLQTAEVSAQYVKYLTWFVGILAFSILLVALSVAFMAVKVVAILTDVKKTFDETKVKALPILGKISDLTHTAQSIVGDLAPKVKAISENAVEISHTVRQTTAKLDVTVRDAADKAMLTFTDVDARTKVQVARVDGMVASTLSATAEIGATINEGIRVPARKIAAIVTQSRHFLDTLLDRARALGININSTVHVQGNPKPKAPR